MNKFLKSQILAAIAHGYVVNTSRLGSEAFVVHNANGEKLLSVNNDWDYGAYSLYINDKAVLFADKNQGSQFLDIIIKEVVEISEACRKRWYEQKKLAEQSKLLESAKQAMTKQEAEIVSFLNGVKTQHTI